METRMEPAVEARPLTLRRFCSRPSKAITFLSDGTAVCACIDAAKTMPLGNINEMSMEEIWNGRAYRDLRQDLIEDHKRRPLCAGCPNLIVNPPSNPGKISGFHLPRFVYIETLAACNLSCPGCDRGHIVGSREEAGDGKGKRMSFKTWCKIIDALSPHLEYLEYHVGGENWAHRESARMVRYAKERNMHLFTLTSTNGLYFNTEEQRRDALLSGIDVIIFSVDGARQESYGRYRVGGSFEQVLENMRAMAAMKARMGIGWPKLVWRYILFNWNDSDEEMQLARDLSREAGVDKIAWHLNVGDPSWSSPRFRRGSSGLASISHELWDNLQGMLPVDPRWDRY